MRDTKKSQIRKKDENGKLVASGFEFYEVVGINPLLSGCLFPIVVFGMFAMLAALFVIFMSFTDTFSDDVSGEAVVISIITIVIFFLFFWRLVKRTNKPKEVKRSVIFMSDDRILVSNRKSATPELVESKVSVSGVQAIHWRPSPAIGGDGQGSVDNGLSRILAWQIDLHLYDGQTVWVAAQIGNEEDVRYVCTQLNQALNELRANSDHFTVFD